MNVIHFYNPSQSGGSKKEQMILELSSSAVLVAENLFKLLRDQMHELQVAKIRFFQDKQESVIQMFENLVGQ